MRDIDTFNRTSILENAKNVHKMAYQTTQHNCRSLVFLRNSKNLTKITEYIHKILQTLIVDVLYNLETSNVPNNKHPGKISASRGLCLNAYQLSL